MRQSLSEKHTALIAVGLSVLLAVIAIVDQAGSRSLLDHATAAYASHGKQASAGALYGLVYGVAVLDVLLWLAVAGLARSHRLVAAVLGVVATLITASLGLTLLLVSEYGVHPYTTLWGVLALLPAAAGAVATVLLSRRK
ncbi:hypothetical protein EV645_0925 [Kribbella rubisoli]|uniref:Uncharacterized protein n=1 Tax=Kribbella rubisoli TaxID=3075929 RepID=A0A4V2FYS4_9ACTN|nr:hypothetical protein [Kribbella rubisoli]RZU18726.1 hypothetical protein EV645_0925 [Kribbella rubisoli]